MKKFLSVQKKKCNRFHVEEKIAIPAQDPQYSAVGFSVIFALLGEQSRVPAFRPSQTLWAASHAVDEGGDTSGVCSAPSLIVSRLRARALALDLGCGTCCPSLRHEESVHHRRLQWDSDEDDGMEWTWNLLGV